MMGRGAFERENRSVLNSSTMGVWVLYFDILTSVDLWVMEKILWSIPIALPRVSPSISVG
jgi:hypothetical protein